MINLHAAKTQLSRLVDRASRGEEIIIARHGKPVARLVPLEVRAARQPGLLEGKLHVADDFDAPLPDDLLAGFLGSGRE